MKLKYKILLIFILSLAIFIVSKILRPHSDIALYTAYPFKIDQGEDKSLEIAFYEKKKLKKISSIELALLSGLYFDKAKVDGNADYIFKSQQNAEASLARFPYPNVQARLILAKIHEYRHDFTTALKIVEEVFQSSPHEVAAIKIALTSHLALGNLAEAERYSMELIRYSPSIGNYTLAGIVAAAKGKDKEAELLFSTALKKEKGGNPGESSWARAMIARFCFERSRFSEAIGLLDEAERITPKNPLVYSMKGELNLRRGEYKIASENFMKAFDESKQSIFLIGYGKSKKAQGEESLAMQVYDQAEFILRDDLKNSVGHRLELATLLLERGLKKDISEAIQLAKAESELRKSSQSYFVLAKAHAAAKEWSAAERAINLTLAYGTKNPEYFAFAQHLRSSRPSK